MTDQQVHNPFEAPATVEQHAVLRHPREFPTPLFKCVVAIFVFEVILAPASMAHQLWPGQQNLSVPCFILNVVVLMIVSWRIGRRLPVAAGLPLSLIVAAFAWLTCIVTANLLNNWSFSHREWKFALSIAVITMALCAITNAAASSYPHKVTAVSSPDEA